MNEALQKQISKILELMLSGLQKTGDLVNQELPGLIHDYLSMYFIEAIPIESILFTIASIIFFITLFKFLHPVIKKEKDFAPMYLFLILPTLGIIGSLGVATTHVKELIMIKVAPKAYLIEKLRQKGE